ncbi:peroxide stress protein YaaA [Labilibacter sediminis]|nr:peroxide stress protein YaaA [Labilibacter sediminis]
MQIIISPAKSLDFDRSVGQHISSSSYRFIKEPQKIVSKLKTLTPDKIATLMKVSTKLADLNYNRFQTWEYPFDDKLGKQALFAFTGDVYTGIDAYSLSDEDVKSCQNTLSILSGLYGLLRPLDLILPYRLEMGTALSFSNHKNLYSFWGNKITKLLNEDIAKNNHKALINLASNEYFKSIQAKDIKVPIITPAFKDLKNGEYKMISFYAKKARGLMTRFIIQNNIKNPEEIKAFDLDGYYFNSHLSTELKPVFTRDHV